eukprot:2080992-Rhodomonas_salina.1
MMPTLQSESLSSSSPPHSDHNNNHGILDSEQRETRASTRKTCCWTAPKEDLEAPVTRRYTSTFGSRI